MRDAKRIDRILDLIEVHWKAHPDWRFGQLLVNLEIVDKFHDEFEIEDSWVEKKLKSKLSKPRLMCACGKCEIELN